MDGTNNPNLPTQGANHVTRHIPCIALRAIGCADVRFGILPSQLINRLEQFWIAEGWSRNAGLLPWMGPTILVLQPRTQTAF